MYRMRFTVFILSLVLLASLAGCVQNPRMQQFAQLSDAGQIYGKAAESFLHQRAKVELERNSLIARDLHNSQQNNRVDYIRKQNDVASRTYALMQSNAEKSRPFANYFSALRQLAQNNDGNNIEVSARQLSDAVGEINGRLKNSMEVSLHVYPFVSSQLLQNSLDEELESRKGLLLDALNVYQAMLGDVSADYQRNLDMQMNSKVITPYSSTKAPSTCWTQRRKSLIIEQSSVRAANDAFGRTSDSLSRAILNMSDKEPSLQALGSLVADAQDLKERVAILAQPTTNYSLCEQVPINNTSLESRKAIITTSNTSNTNKLPPLSNLLDYGERTELPVKPVTAPLVSGTLSTIDFRPIVTSQGEEDAARSIGNDSLCGANMYGPVQDGETLFAVARALKKQGIGSDVGLSRLAATIFTSNKTVFKQQNINRLAPESCLSVPSKDAIAAMSDMEAKKIIVGQ
ncbi:MAG: hypothetical protein R8L53_01655 [Mariprofundales bacterium]